MHFPSLRASFTVIELKTKRPPGPPSESPETFPSSRIRCRPIRGGWLRCFQGRRKFSSIQAPSSSGEDATVQPRMTQAVGEGYVADMAEEGEPLLIADPQDERLTSRNAGLRDDKDAVPITTAWVVPLLQDGAEVGVLEAVNKDIPPFDDDDEFFLTTIAETVSSALKNASLLSAERKLEILEALVRVKNARPRRRRSLAFRPRVSATGSVKSASDPGSVCVTHPASPDRRGGLLLAYRCRAVGRRPWPRVSIAPNRHSCRV